MASTNMYRVGDFVYFETSASAPYQIRKIDELNKTTTGAVEAKVVCFYRRRDISNQLVQLADKHHKIFGSEDGNEENSNAEEDAKPSRVAAEQKHKVKHRELFLSRQVETLPATHIRGKCTVTLHNETDSPVAYLDKEDGFFYQLIYDPVQKTLLADKGEIRVGSKYQATILPKLKEADENDGRECSKLETLIWSPEHGLSDTKLDEFILLARSVGTLARAYDHTSSVRQPNLLMSAAAASRDITKQRALDILHKVGYDVPRAIADLVPRGQPALCRDEMEEWSASEGNLFEEAIEKYGKFFHDIHNDFLPWKSPKGIVEYYYMWKTTDHYVQQKRIKAAESEHKLKQVYIPNYNKPNPAVLYAKPSGESGSRGCESCLAQSSPMWYSWGTQAMQCKLCQCCWSYWKRYGGLKTPTKIGNGTGGNQVNSQLGSKNATVNVGNGTVRCSVSGCDAELCTKWELQRHLAEQHANHTGTGGSTLNSNILAWGGAGKSRSGFYLHTVPAMRVGRRLCADLICTSRLSKKPFSKYVIPAQVQKEATVLLEKLDATTANSYLGKRRRSSNLTTTTKNLYALTDRVEVEKLPSFLLRDKPPIRAREPEKLTFPRDANVMKLLNKTVFAEKEVVVDPILDGVRNGVSTNGSPASSLDATKSGSKAPSEHDPTETVATLAGKKRAMVTDSDDVKDEPLRKRQQTASSVVPTKKSGAGSGTSLGTLMFIANETVKKGRKSIGNGEMRKLGRRPWKETEAKLSLEASKSNSSAVNNSSGATH